MQEQGYCECGCGQVTLVARRTRTELGHVRGQHLRFVNGHNARGARDWTEVEGGCWEWNGTRSIEGYGVLREQYQQVKAHRWVYEQLVGPIPSHMTIDHLCRNRACVNPAHLEVVTRAENARRARLYQEESRP